jgi:hypothetical protein
MAVKTSEALGGNEFVEIMSINDYTNSITKSCIAE